MSKVFCVSYDLCSHDNEYSGLFKVLQGCRRWWRFLNSTWLVVDDSYENLWARLQPQLGPKDRLLIISVNAEWAGTLPEQAWQWIEQNLGEGNDAESHQDEPAPVALYPEAEKRELQSAV